MQKLIPTTPTLDYMMDEVRKIEVMPGTEGQEARRDVAVKIQNTWDSIAATFPKYIGVYKHNLTYNTPKIVALFTPDFCVAHNIFMTQEQLIKGPKTGTTWYIRANLFPLSLLPGVPYIYIPGFPVYPLFRITNNPWSTTKY